MLFPSDMFIHSMSQHIHQTRVAQIKSCSGPKTLACSRAKINIILPIHKMCLFMNETSKVNKILGFVCGKIKSFPLGIVHKWRPNLKGRGGQGVGDNSTKASVINIVTMRGGGSKIFLNCVTSFMDDPLATLNIRNMLRQLCGKHFSESFVGAAER